MKSSANDGDGEEEEDDGIENDEHSVCNHCFSDLSKRGMSSFCSSECLAVGILAEEISKAAVVITSAQAGPIACGRPILKARVPAFCNVHLQKAHRALKKAGLHISSSSKLAPKFHVMVAEYVRQIRANRRAALRANTKSVVVKRESCI